MEEQTINLPRYSLSIKQSSKGFWYCEKIKVTAENEMDVEMFLNNATKIILKKLEELNRQ